MPIPKTNITGTDGGSNFTFPVFANGMFALIGVLIVSERLSPLLFFHSASESGAAVEFASVFTRVVKKSKLIAINNVYLFLHRAH